MKPQWRFSIDCTCGHTALAGTSEAGTSLCCAGCGEDLRVPSLRELKLLPAIDVSPIGRIESQIAERQRPFDGNCQLCDVCRGTSALPVNVVAYSTEGEHARSFLVPCVLCDGCVSDFRRGIWSGRLQSLLGACLKVIWLFFGLIVASIVALILPLLGIAAVLGFVSGLFVYLTRKRANPFVLRHINKLCNLDDTLAQADGYRARAGRWINLTQHQ